MLTLDLIGGLEDLQGTAPAAERFFALVDAEAVVRQAVGEQVNYVSAMQPDIREDEL